MDAGLEVLAREGSRGLTHRAVDAEAALPAGTCVNYFRSKQALFAALGERIFERLTPSKEALEEGKKQRPSRERLIELMRELMQRVNAQPQLQLALWELRLESTRQPELRKSLANTLKAALQLDFDFHREAQLPGGDQEVVLLHLAVEGLILNTITLPEVLEIAGNEQLIDTIVERLVPQEV